MLPDIDSVVLAWVEKKCHWAQERTGVTNFGFARLSHLLVAAIVFAVFPPLSEEARRMLLCITFFALMYGKIVWGWYTKAEGYYASGAGDAMHPLTQQWRMQSHVRLFFGTLILVFFGWSLFLSSPQRRQALEFLVACVFWLAALYLQCCVPLPPGRDKGKGKRIRGLFWLELLRPVHTPA